MFIYKKIYIYIYVCMYIIHTVARGREVDDGQFQNPCMPDAFRSSECFCQSSHTHSSCYWCALDRFCLPPPVRLPSIKSHHSLHVLNRERFSVETCCYSAALDLSTGLAIFSLSAYQVYSSNVSSDVFV